MLPVIKHIPGHGRAKADSHLDLPVVDVGWERARRPRFRAVPGVRDMPMAMTAHVIYSVYDDRSARPPPRTSVMGEVIRERDRLRRPGDERRPVDEGARGPFAERARGVMRPAAMWSCTATATWRR